MLLATGLIYNLHARGVWCVLRSEYLETFNLPDNESIKSRPWIEIGQFYKSAINHLTDMGYSDTSLSQQYLLQKYTGVFYLTVVLDERLSTGHNRVMYHRVEETQFEMNSFRQ